MCTQKREIILGHSQQIQNKWLTPWQLSGIYHANGQAKMMVKCGQCTECKLERARNWTYKIWLEALEAPKKCFLTLTYAKNPKTLIKKDLQDFIKRLRKNTKADLKYFGAGEYGEKKGRPHYHIIIIGWQPTDIKIHQRKSSKNKIMYTSDFVKKTWGHGIITVQPFAKNEIAYSSLYINHNQLINPNINKEAIKFKKKEQLKLKIEYGILKNDRLKSANNKYYKARKVTDLTPNELYEYKKKAGAILKKYKELLKIQPEFNIWSKGMGFNKYLKSYTDNTQLKIDNYVFETPKEYIRKILDNKEQYDEITVNNTIMKALDRKKYAEENYIDPNSKQAKRTMKTLEKIQLSKQFNARKMMKNSLKETDF